MSQDNKSIALSIVIPVYNGENSISRLVDELVDFLAASFTLEIILVNDIFVAIRVRTEIDLKNLLFGIKHEYKYIINLFQEKHQNNKN